jgi:DNA-binding transcriptional MerR regulator
MARLSGSTLRTVRFYEEEGLLTPAERSDNGHRLFAPEELQKLQLILDLREAGLSLGDIKSLFELKTRCDSPEEASKAMSEILERQLADMQRKIAKLRCLRDELVSTVSVISECRGCEDQRFPYYCHECDVLKQPDLPRAVRILWSG